MIKQRSLLMFILLTFVTCGIYSIIFWYQFAEDMNKVCEGDGKETNSFIVVILLSIVTCGIYPYFWFYSMGNRMQENAPRYGLAFQENGTTILLWMIFGILLCGVGQFFAFYILIKNMNSIGEAYNARFTGTPEMYQ